MDNKVMSKIFLWMFIGLITTFITGYIISINEKMLLTVFSTGAYIFFTIAELVLVIVLSAKIRKMKPTTCKVMFILYAFVSALTFSSIFIVYKITSIIYIFLITAIIFGIFSFIGYTTKIDLTKIGTYLLMALLGVVLVSIINLFVGSQVLDLALSGIIIFIFMGITAYDIQKIKNNYSMIIPEDNLPIYGALQLYLDYINIFLNLLRLFGDDR
jgi:hypothetical protein